MSKNNKPLIALSGIIMITQCHLIGASIPVQQNSNPFYPKYLKQDISRAVNKVVSQKIKIFKKLEKKRLSQLEADSEKSLKKPVTKSKKVYPRIPSFLLMQSQIKNSTGMFILKTIQGTTIQRGSKIYEGRVTSIGKSSLILKRHNKNYIISYRISFN